MIAPMREVTATIIDDDTPTTVAASTDGERLVVSADDLRTATGWELKPEGLCRGDVCIPLLGPPVQTDGAGGLVDVAAVAAALQRPLAAELEGEPVAVLGITAGDRDDALRSGAAPDVTLADLDGTPRSLLGATGTKRVVVTWASWCGCRYDLPAWQALHEELAPHGLNIVAVNFDGDPEAARPWVQEVDPQLTFPVLVDPEQVTAERYGMVNVPSVVWIDEDDHIVRAPTIAPGDDAFRSFTDIDSATHHDALRRWVVDGVAPEADAAAPTNPTTPELQLARAEHRLALVLWRAGRDEAAERHYARAAELAPFDFTIVRGSMLQRGQDPFGPEFFAFWDRWSEAGRPGYNVVS
jgi:peroxiredoxin